MIEQNKKVVWTIDEIERALQSDTLNETGIHDIEYFYSADKAVLKSEIKDYLNEEIEYLENHVKRANKGIKINLERIESLIFKAKKIRKIYSKKTRQLVKDALIYAEDNNRIKLYELKNFVDYDIIPLIRKIIEESE